ncbi:MAG: NTP transferase domain-containing protein [Burkholderiales bacterium]|nr:NTP transferase domain-containing protein [Burkholderiales bacterium]
MSAQPTVIVLASGRGDRFVASGGQGSKLRALLAGKPVIEHTLAAVQASGLPWHLEDAGHAGMGDSIAAAVAATRDAQGWLVLPADLPLVQPASLLAVAAALEAHDLVLPVHGGQRGHPVGFGPRFRDELLALSGLAGAAAIVQANRAFRLELADPGIVTDIDTVQDLRAAEQELNARR